MNDARLSMEPTLPSGVVDALGCVAGALSFALLQPPGTPKRRAFALLIVGSAWSGFVMPWVCDLLALWAPRLLTDHARGGLSFLGGLAGVIIAQAIVDGVRERASAGVRRLLDFVFGPGSPPL
jgi:hypothetical protein